MQVEEFEVLGGADLLGCREFEGAGMRGDPAAGDGPGGGVRCGRPLIYPGPTADLPGPVQRRAEVTGAA